MRLRASLAAVAALAAGLATAACASSGAVPRPYPGYPADDATAPPGAEDVAPSSVPAAPVAFADAIVESASELVGTPYREGGSDPGGFDCSGFVQYVFSRAGAALPRSVREQWHAGVEVGAVAAGDLVFFAIDGRQVSHVGIAIDGERFVHAPSGRGAVRVERLSGSYWRSRLAGVRRITPSPASGAERRAPDAARPPS
jgi:cell wall-associated NlpC family hydrolase